MLPTIATGNVGSALAGEFEVANSLRFDQASNDYLNITLGTATNNKIWTFSCWVKRSTDSANQQHMFFGSGGSGNDNWFQIQFNASNQIQLSGYSTAWLKTNRLFRDQSAWYHVVVQADSTQATASDRLKLYVNGTQETSFGTDNRSSITQNQTWGINKAVGHSVGSENPGSYMDGYMCEVVFIDGSTLAPTSFGEFDEDTGIWKPIDVSGLTFGTNGFYLDFENSGSLGNDKSGNGNNFTVNNLTSIDQTTDTCTNNFATMSTPTWFDGTISNGGLTITTNQTSYRYQPSSIGVNSGKWYWEIKLTTRDEYALMGITDAPSPINVGTDWILGSGAYDYSVVYNTAGGDGNKYNNAGESPTNTPGAFMGGFAEGDIIMFALDCDNNTLKIGTNDLWSNGSGSTNQTFSNTTPISITAPSSTNTGFYFPAVGDYGGAISVFDLNFGSPPFTISSGNSDGNGYGNFEYSVPSGYYALNTKNLAEYG